MQNPEILMPGSKSVGSTSKARYTFDDKFASSSKRSFEAAVDKTKIARVAITQRFSNADAPLIQFSQRREGIFARSAASPR